MTRSAALDALVEGLDLSRRALVGIVGAPGAGKSTLAAALAAEASASGLPATVLSMDGFHLPQARLRQLGRRERMGAPDTFDVEGFATVLAALRRPGAVRAPIFDRDREEPAADALTIEPETRLVVVEGNYLVHEADGWQRIRPLLDRVAYLEVDDDLRRRRLLARHITHGKIPDAAAAWVAAVDEPNAELIARGRARADAIIALA